MAASGGEQAAAAAAAGDAQQLPPRVLSIQSHVVSGYVGNKVRSSSAVPHGRHVQVQWKPRRRC